jgi:SH3-like domain-containing protein
MKFKATSPSLSFLWRITIAVAILLLVFTLLLVVKSQMTASTSFTGYINSQNAPVYLRSEPNETGRTIALLNPGTAVNVDRSTIREEITWYHIQTESGSGWIPESNLSLSKP